jgi:hypothetical protein
VNVSPKIDAMKRYLDDLVVALTHRGAPIPTPAAEREGVPLARLTLYDVALSFAGEDRPYVELVAEQLRSRGTSVFYDRDEEAHLWGKNLYEYLSDLYQHRARFVLMFVSRHYAGKRWPNHERKAAQARALSEAGEYILPARFDDTDVPGLLPTIGFVDLRRTSPAELAVLVCEKLGRIPVSIKANEVPAPVNLLLAGEARFDYSSHDGRFRIGQGLLEFETRWSKGSDKTIRCYSDSTNLRGVALAPRGAALGELASVASLDYTSRVRSVPLGQIVILQNTKGIYAAVRVLGIQDNTRGGADRDELHFAYWIQSNGSDSFVGLGEN